MASVLYNSGGGGGHSFGTPTTPKSKPVSASTGLNLVSSYKPANAANNIIQQPSVGGSNAMSGVGNWNDILKSITDANNAFNIAQVNAANAFNASEAQKNRDWQERMARNAHQYEVQDLIAAGLNPILSAGGQGAFVGSGAQATAHKATADDTLSKGLITLLGAMIAANSAANVAQIYTANQRFMAENYVTNPWQLINLLLSDGNGSGSAINKLKRLAKGS